MLQHPYPSAWARHALVVCTFLFLQACMGSDFELAAKKKQPAKAGPSASSVVEVPLDPDDGANAGHNTQAFSGRLLGGGQCHCSASEEPARASKLLQAAATPGDAVAATPAHEASAFEQALQQGGEELASVIEEGLSDNSPANTDKLIAALTKLAEHHVQQGDKTHELSYYTEAAIHYQIILRTCNKDEQRHSKEIKAACERLTQIRTAMLQACQATGTAPSPAALAQEIAGDKNILAALRARAQQCVDKLTPMQEGTAQREDEAEATLAFIQGTREVFADIARTVGSFLAKLYRECEEELGPAPCKYAVMGVGSMASQQMTPYSDAEFCMLMEDPKDEEQAEQWRDYLRKLTHLVNFRIINLGESVIPKNKYGVSLDHLCQMGFNLDLGGKTPLNRKGKYYDLIQPVSGMLHYLRNKNHEIEHIDKLLPFILENTCYVHGDKSLFEAYAKAKASFITQGKTAEGTPVYQARTLQVLREGITEIDYTKPTKDQKKIIGTLAQFNPREGINWKKEGQLYNVKQEVYRLPDRLLYRLAMYYGIMPHNVWDAVDQLVAKGVIDSGAAERHLQFAASFATTLRLLTYLHNKSQQETMTMERGEKVSEEETKEKVATAFALSKKALTPKGGLFKYYYAMLPLHKKMEDLFGAGALGEVAQRSTDFFKGEVFCEDSAQTKGDICRRLLQPLAAQKHWQVALEEQRKKYGDKPHPQVATSYHNIAGVHYAQGKYPEALEAQQKALKMLLAVYGKRPHPQVASSYNNIGSVYKSQGKYPEALEAYDKALKMYLAVYGKRPHPDVATSYNNIGLVYKNQGKYPEALEAHQEALKMKLAVYGKRPNPQ
ncbi:MAG: tetratricopeptide repeat protein, partial [Bacteroidota bacterium]